MATIVTRAVKGSALSHNEMDANFNNLNTDKLEADVNVILKLAKGSDIASATAISIPTDGNYFDITGTTTIQTITAKQAGSTVNLCTIPVFAINWNYKREKIYGIENTWRREHTRWQRYGPNLSQIKLVTVKGHEVKFKKTGAIR